MKTFFNNSTGAVKAVEIGNHVIVDGRKGHVAKLGRKYVEILFYGAGRIKIDPTSPVADWPGTSHT